MSDIFTDPVGVLTVLLGGNQLLLIFVISILGNVVPFVPYLLVVVTLAETPQFQSVGLVQVAAVAALGASIGKFVIYGLGYGVSEAMSGSRARFDSLRRLLGGSAFLVAFLFAASPLPDDVVFIPLGIMRYSPVKTFISLFSGKFTLTVLVVYLGRRSSDLLKVFLGGGWVSSLVSIVAVVALSLIMARIDWEKVLMRRRPGLLRRLLNAVWRRLRWPRGRPHQASNEPVGPPRV